MADEQTNTETPNIDPNKEIADKMFPNSGDKKETVENVTPPPAENKETTKEATKEADPTKELSKEDIKEISLPQNAFISEKDFNAFKEYAKEQGLTNKQAQALLEKQNEQLGQFVESQIEAYKEKIANYETAVKSDKEIGGANFNKSITLAKRVLEKYGNESLKAELDQSGFGSHPEVIRLLSKIGQAIGDDTLIAPKAPAAPKPKSLAETLYGKTQ